MPSARLGPWVLATDRARYYLALAVAAAMILAALNVAATRTGRAFLAIRASEVAAQASGINAAAYKTIAFVLSAFYTGVAGGLFAFVVGFLSPDAFDVFLSVDFLVMIILGGLGSVWGSVAGAAVVTVLNDSLAGFQTYRPLIFGAIMIVCMLFAPGGLAAVTRRQSMRSRRPLGGRLGTFIVVGVIAALAGLAGPAPAAAEPGVTDTEILLGGSNSFSGPLAFTGAQATKAGVDLYFRVLNDAGGVHGRKIRTIYYDDGYRPQDAVANTKKLVRAGRDLRGDRAAGLAAGGRHPRLSRAGQGPDALPVPELDRDAQPEVRLQRRVVLSDRQSRMMIDYLAGPRKFKRFAALYQDDEYGKSFLTAFEADLGRHGLKLIATEPVKRGVTDVSAQTAKLQAAKPEVTFLVLTPGPAAQALKERQKIGWTDTLMVSTGPLTDETYLGLAGDASEGVEGLATLPDPLRSDQPGIKLYRDHLQKYVGKNEPNRYSLSGYLAGMLFAEAAKRAGRTLTRDGLVAALETLKGFDTGIVPPITIGPEHDTQKQGFWVRVEAGRFKPLSDWLKSDP